MARAPRQLDQRLLRQFCNQPISILNYVSTPLEQPLDFPTMISRSIIVWFQEGPPEWGCWVREAIRHIVLFTP